jgi:ankyrin repeat protein
MEIDIEQPVDIIDNNHKRKIDELSEHESVQASKKVKTNNIVSSCLVDETTKKIFLHPVLLPNGKIYEKDVLVRMLNVDDKIDGVRYDETDFIVCPTIEEMIKNHLDEHPEDKANQFMTAEDVNQCIHDGNFDRLLNCDKFYFGEIRNPKKLCEQAPINVLKYFIDKCEDLNCRDRDDDWYLIHHFIFGSDPEVVKYLINKNVELEVCDLENWRPIHFAIQYSTPEIIKLLINKKVHLNVITDDEKTPLHFAIEYSTLEIIKLLTNKDFITRSDNKKWYPLHYAARYSNLEVFQFLFESGAILSVETKFKQYPIHLALYYGKNDVAKFIMDKDIAQWYNRDLFGYNTLHLIILHSDCEMLKYFFGKFTTNAGIKNSVIRSTSDNTSDNILHVALTKQSKEMIEYVISISDHYMFYQENITRDTFDSLVSEIKNESVRKHYFDLKNKRLTELEKNN